jgi:hypothetical protein
VIAYSALFLDGGWSNLFVVIGILCAVVLELILVIFFAAKIQKIKYKEEIASAGLVLLAVLISIGIV